MKDQGNLKGRFRRGLLNGAAFFVMSVGALTAADHNTALANPSGGQVVAGQAQIIQNGITTTIQQQSQRAVIEWQNFSIDSGELTQFLQNNSNAAVLNKVVSSLPSHIYGDLTANGRVFLVNPNGVVIGNGARIDTHTFLATTLNIAAGNFMDGGDLHFQGDSASAIVNLGEIHAGHGDVFLIAHQVRNEGTISAPKGEVALVAAADVYLSTEGPDGSRITVKANDFAEGMDNLIGVDNKGLIEAARVKLAAMDGDIYDMAINNSGTIRAVGMQEGVDGTIQLVATGAGSKVENSGSLFARKSNGSGGRVDIFGERIALKGTTVIDVSGTGSVVTAKTEAGADNRGFNGGGIIRVGGDYQGQGDVTRAQTTTVESGAVLKADAVDHGDGGKVIVWADEQTRFSGTITARGGAISGNGGFVETSGKERLQVTADAYVDASSEVGGVGAWLLDPRNVTLEQGVGGGDLIADSDGEQVDIAVIETALDLGNSVTVTTGTTGGQEGDITVVDTINKGGGGEATLTLKAARNIIFDDTNGGEVAGIVSAVGVLNVVLNADADSNLAGAVQMDTATITTNGGFLVIGGGSNVVDSDGNGILGDGGFGPDMIAAYGTDTLDSGVELIATTISTGAGDVIITGHGQSSAIASNQYGVNLVDFGGTGTTITTTTGNIKITGTGGAGIDANEGVRISGANTAIQTNTGEMSFIGTGNSTGDPLADQNFGVHIRDGASVTSVAAGAGDVTITGTGGGGGDDMNEGVRISDATTIVTSNEGNIVITGTGGGVNASVDNNGVAIDASATVSSTGTGANAATISITGTGNLDGYGVALENGATVTSAEGDVTITATGATQNDIQFNAAPVLTATAAATDITLYIDSLTTAAADPTISATGNISITPRTASRAINLGAAAPAGGLDITAAQLALFAATGTLSIGDAVNGTGLVTINTLDLATVSDLDIDGGSIIAQNLTNIAGNVPLLTARIGNLTFIEDDTSAAIGAAILADIKTNFQTLAGDLILAPETGASDIGIAGGAGVYTFSFADLQGFTQIGGNLVIGDPNGGSGIINVNAFDASALSYGLGFQGGTFALAGNVVSAKDFLVGADVFTLNGNNITAGQNIILEPQTVGRNVGVGTGLGDTQITNAMIALLNVGERYNLIIGDQDEGAGIITVAGVDLTDRNHGIGLFGGTVNVRSNLISDGDILIGGDSINVETFFDEQPFTLTAGTYGDVLIRPMSDGTAIELDGQTGYIQFGGVDQLAFSQINITAGAENTLTVGKQGTGTGTVTIDGLNMSARDYNLAVYGGSATVTNSQGAGFGINMSARDFILHAQGGGDILVEATIQRDNAAAGKVALVADENITFNNNGDINATTGALNTVVNADADGNRSGRIVVSNVVLNTNGGHLTMGGGTYPGGTAAYGNAGGTAGILIDTSTIITGNGDLYMTGHAHDNAAVNDLVGISIVNNSVLTTTGGEMRLIGTGGQGIDRNHGVSIDNSALSSTVGVISITGVGGSVGTDASSDNLGVSITTGATVSSFGALASTAATIDIIGMGGAGGSNNWGVGISDADSLVTTDAGAVTIRGTGGSNGSLASTNNFGISLANDGDVTSTGTDADAGALSLIGMAGNGHTNSIGVRIDGAGTAIQVTDGDLAITGTGGTTGQITSNNNYGVSLTGTATVTSTGETVANAGKITVTGTGGAGEDSNTGVFIDADGTLITADAGAITVTGTGGSNGQGDSDANHGVHMTNRAAITSTGTDADAATITVTGTSGAGDEGGRGVYLQGDGTSADYIESVDGNISITGTARSFNTASSDNVGFLINSAARVNSTGTTATGATVTIAGTGAAGEDNNTGIWIAGALTRVQSEQGDITLTGTGGSNGSATSSGNDGVLLNGTASVRSLGTGGNAANITVTGVAGNGHSENRGVHMDGSTTSIQTADGDVTVTGTGGSSAIGGADDNAGIYINEAQVVSTGATGTAGNLVFNGTGGVSDNDNEGFRLQGADGRLQTQAGDITITGDGRGSGTGNNGIEIDEGTVTTNAGTADLAFIADEAIFTTAPTINAQNNLILKPTTDTLAINIGDAAFGAGFNLDETYLAQFVGSVGNRIVIGDTAAATTAATIDTLDLANVPTLQVTGTSVLVQNLTNIAGNVPFVNALTGDLRFVEADVPTAVGEAILADVQTNFTTQVGDLYLIPENAASTVGLAGGIGDYSFTLGNLASFAQIGGNLIIGDKENASGAVNINALDLATAGATYGLGVFGGSITVAGNVETAGDLWLGADTFTLGANTLTAANDLWLQAITDATNITIDAAGDGIDFGAVEQTTISQLAIGGKLILGDADNGAGNVTIDNAFDMTALGYGLALYGDTLTVGATDGIISAGDLILGFDNFSVADDLQAAIGSEFIIRAMTTNAAVAIDGTAGTEGTIDFGGAGDALDFDFIVMGAAGDRLTIGDVNNGTGAVSVINNWDVTNYGNFRLAGGSVTVNGLANANDTAMAFVARTGDAVIQNITSNATGVTDRFMHVTAADDITIDTVTVNALAGTGKFDVLLNADRDADQNGSIFVTDSAFTTTGGYFVAGGGSGALDSDGNTILGDAGNGPDVTFAYGDATQEEGVIIDNTSISTAAGHISVMGKAFDNAGVDDLVGVILQADATLTATTGRVTVTGTGGAGKNNNYGVLIQGDDAIAPTTTVSSQAGGVFITGVAGSDGTTSNTDNYGVVIEGGADVTSTGTGGGAGALQITGTAGLGNSNSFGVLIRNDGTGVTTNDGDITITGVATSNGLAGSNNNHGVVIRDQAEVISLGAGLNAGAVNINGTGGNAEDNNYGVLIEGDDTIVRVNAGAMNIVGQGGTTGTRTSDNNYGVYIQDQALVESTSNGSAAQGMTITGTGGAGQDHNYGVFIEGDDTLVTTRAGNMNINGTGGTRGVNESDHSIGVRISNQASISSTGNTSDAGDITITGIGGNGYEFNRGVEVDGNGVDLVLTTVNGDITLDGRGGTNGASGSQENQGVYLSNNVAVNSTGTGSGGRLIMIGRGAAAESENHGVELADASVDITTVDGNIDITGFGGSNGTSSNNVGVLINAGEITSTGNLFSDAGDIIITGTGAAGQDMNDGVRMQNTTTVSSVAGDITITGTGGTNQDGASDTNRGIALTDTTIDSTGNAGEAGRINMTGTGAGAQHSNYGIDMGTGTLVRSDEGNMQISATGGSLGHVGSDNNFGLYMHDSADIQSVGAGADAATVEVTGTAGNGDSNNFAIYMKDTGTSISSAEGEVNVTTSEQGYGVNNVGLVVDGATIETTADATNIVVNTNTAELMNGPTISATNDILFVPTAVSTDIGVAGGLGLLDLSAREIRFLTPAGSLTIGDGAAGTGAITVDGLDFSGAAFATLSFLGGSFNGRNLTQGTKNLIVNALDGDATLVQDSIDLTAGSSITATGDVYLRPETAGRSIGIAGGVGDFNLSDAELAVLFPGSELIIGDSVNGTGAVDIDVFDYSGQTYDLIVHGGSITATNVTTAGNALTLNARTGDIIYRRDDLVLGNGSQFTAANDIYLIPLTPTNTIGVSGGVGAFNIVDLELDFMNPGNKLVIGDSVNGTGAVDIDTVDFTDKNYDIEFHGGSITADDLFNGANALTLNARVSDIIWTEDNIGLSAGSSITAAGNITVKPKTIARTIGLSGGAGDFNITDTELAYFTAGDTFIIGDSVNGIGAVDIVSWDFSGAGYDVEVHGGQVVASDLVMGANRTFLNARVSDVVVTQDVLDIADGSNFTAVRDVILQPANNSTTVGISGGVGTFNISDAELALMNPLGSLVLGRQIGGIGNVNLVGLDYSARNFTLEIYGGQTRIENIVPGANPLIVNTNIGDLTFSQNTFDLAAGSDISAQNDIYLLPEAVGTSIGISGGAGTFNLNDDEIGYLLPRSGRLVIGLQNLGLGAVDVDGWAFNTSLFERVEIYGGSITASDLLPDTKDLIMAAQAGDMTITQDFALFNGANSSMTATGDIVLTPTTATTSIGLSGGAGGLNLSDHELSIFEAGGRFTIGDRNNGVGAVDIQSMPVTENFMTVVGGDTVINGINISGALEVIANTGNINIQDEIISGAAGNAVILAALNGEFFNNEPETFGITPGTGRFLIYAGSAKNSNAGSLVPKSQILFNQTFAANPPSSISAPGNFIFFRETASEFGVAQNVIVDEQGESLPVNQQYARQQQSQLIKNFIMTQRKPLKNMMTGFPESEAEAILAVSPPVTSDMAPDTSVRLGLLDRSCALDGDAIECFGEMNKE